MKIIWVASSFSGTPLMPEVWSAVEDLAFDRYMDIDGVIITKDAYTVQGLTSYQFNKKDNVNFALYWLLKNVDLSEYDAMVFADVHYMSDTTVCGKMLDALDMGKNIVHVKRQHSPLYNFFNYATLKISNAINGMLLGTRENRYVKDFVAFDKATLSLMREFPYKCGMIKETAYLINADIEILPVESKYPLAKSERFNPTGYILSALEAGIAFASFMVAVWIPLDISSVLWLIIAMIVFGVVSVLHLSLTSLNRLIKMSSLRETPNVLVASADTVDAEVETSEYETDKPAQEPSVEYENTPEHDTLVDIVDAESATESDTESDADTLRAPSTGTSKKSTSTSKKSTTTKTTKPKSTKSKSDSTQSSTRKTSTTTSTASRTKSATQSAKSTKSTKDTTKPKSTAKSKAKAVDQSTSTTKPKKTKKVGDDNE